MNIKEQEKVDFLIKDFANSINFELELKNGFETKVLSDIYYTLILSASRNNDQIEIFYNKQSGELSATYVRQIEKGLYSKVMANAIMKTMKPHFGLPAFSFEAIDQRFPGLLLTRFVYPEAGKEDLSFKRNKKQFPQMTSFVNYKYLQEEYNRKGETPSESGI